MANNNLDTWQNAEDSEYYKGGPSNRNFSWTALLTGTGVGGVGGFILDRYIKGNKDFTSNILHAIGFGGLGAAGAAAWSMYDRSSRDKANRDAIDKGLKTGKDALVENDDGSQVRLRFKDDLLKEREPDSKLLQHLGWQALGIPADLGLLVTIGKNYNALSAAEQEAFMRAVEQANNRLAVAGEAATATSAIRKSIGTIRQLNTQIDLAQREVAASQRAYDGELATNPTGKEVEAFRKDLELQQKRLADLQAKRGDAFKSIRENWRIRHTGKPPLELTPPLKRRYDNTEILERSLEQFRRQGNKGEAPKGKFFSGQRTKARLARLGESVWQPSTAKWLGFSALSHGAALLLDTLSDDDTRRATINWLTPR